MHFFFPICLALLFPLLPSIFPNTFIQLYSSRALQFYNSYFIACYSSFVIQASKCILDVCLVYPASNGCTLPWQGSVWLPLPAKDKKSQRKSQDEPAKPRAEQSSQSTSRDISHQISRDMSLHSREFSIQSSRALSLASSRDISLAASRDISLAASRDISLQASRCQSPAEGPAPFYQSQSRRVSLKLHMLFVMFPVSFFSFNSSQLELCSASIFKFSIGQFMSQAVLINYFLKKDFIIIII